MRRFHPAAVLLLLAACGGDDGSSSQPPAPVEGEDEVAEAWCEALVRCGQYPDLETCMASIDVVGPEVRGAVENGNASFDPAAAGDCEAALGQVTCEELGGAADLEACGEVWDGTVPDGGDCAVTAECAEGWCDPGDCDPALSCCTGVCAAVEDEGVVPIGGDCSVELCSSDAYCDYEAVPATCRQLVAADAPCHEGECIEGLYCRITDLDAGTGVCSGLPDEGEPCDPDYPVCARADNWCDPADNMCRRLALVGDSCDEVSDNCVAYAWCSPDGMCVARPGEGDPCEDWPPCMGDLECVDDTCVIPPIEDESGDCE
jgi:hypothetical protein